MPLDNAQKNRVGVFLVSLLKGTADVGFASLPLLTLYKQAKDEKVPLVDMVVANPEALDGIMDAMKRQAKKLPPHALAALAEIIKSAQE